jgi:hypothetical protein
MAPLLQLLAACGTVSNAPFDDDADFLAALPSEARHTVSLDAEAAGEAARGLGEPAELVGLSSRAADEINGFTFAFLDLLEQVRSLPPATRTDDARRWGPAAVECGVDVTLLMSREASVYDWSLVGHRAGGEADATVLYGTHFGAAPVEAGDGAVVWDHGRWSEWCGVDEQGLVALAYDSREGVDLLGSVTGYSREGSAPVDRMFAYTRTTDSADFEFRLEADLVAAGGEAAPAVAVRDRWLAGVGGRSDAVVTGGSGGGDSWRWSQCWDLGGLLVYEVGDSGNIEESGSAADCAFQDFAELERT